MSFTPLSGSLVLTYCRTSLCLPCYCMLFVCIKRNLSHSLNRFTLYCQSLELCSIFLTFKVPIITAVTKTRGRGFFPGTVSVSPGYFLRKQKENRTKRTSQLYISSPINLHLPGNLKFQQQPCIMSSYHKIPKIRPS